MLITDPIWDTLYIFVLREILNFESEALSLFRRISIAHAYINDLWQFSGSTPRRLGHKNRMFTSAIHSDLQILMRLNAIQLKYKLKKITMLCRKQSKSRNF